ncbi:hypothetical protein JTB14_030584 [Gonioctena quinquepunctata]|nr:hypothetical protein JTB14_030584 [Gonioctena quinquepunctata]
MIQNLIQKTPGSATDVVAKGGGKKKNVHVLGLDTITHKEEIVKAIEDQAKLQNTEDITVRSLRPTSIGTQNATVELQESIAESLIKTGHIKVGWLSCTVRERIQLQRCYKCQQMGHVRENCTGENRTGDCLRCGKGGHNAKECPEENEEFYHNCKRATEIAA